MEAGRTRLQIELLLTTTTDRCVQAPVCHVSCQRVDAQVVFARKRVTTTLVVTGTARLVQQSSDCRQDRFREMRFTGLLPRGPLASLTTFVKMLDAARVQQHVTSVTSSGSPKLYHSYTVTLPSRRNQKAILNCLLTYLLAYIIFYHITLFISYHTIMYYII